MPSELIQPRMGEDGLFNDAGVQAIREDLESLKSQSLLINKDLGSKKLKLDSLDNVINETSRMSSELSQGLRSDLTQAQLDLESKRLKIKAIEDSFNESILGLHSLLSEVRVELSQLKLKEQNTNNLANKNESLILVKTDYVLSKINEIESCVLTLKECFNSRTIFIDSKFLLMEQRLENGEGVHNSNASMIEQLSLSKANKGPQITSDALEDAGEAYDQTAQQALVDKVSELEALLNGMN